MRVADHGGVKDNVAAGSHGPRGHWLAVVIRSKDSYSLVMLLIFLDYIAASLLSSHPWGRVITVVLLSTLLVLALYTSRAGRPLMILAGIAFVLNTSAAVASALVPQAETVNRLGPVIGGVLLLLAPIVILRRIATHRTVTLETILAAIDVYLLLGIIFALIYLGIDIVTAEPFFQGAPEPTGNEYLFFSYTTLTTTGYGNLVPSTNIGRTLAMVEALVGQIYVLVFIARLVALWGQERPGLQDQNQSRTQSTHQDDREGGTDH